MQGDGTVMNKSVFQAQAGRNAVSEIQPMQFDFAQCLPDVPVLPETLLLLDLEIQESCVDLRVISQLVLNDLGAAVQILRLAGSEYGYAEGRPTRIADCISDLGLHACMEAVSAQTVTRDRRSKGIAEIWAHSREIAHYSKLIAAEMPEVNPEEAYLVGLFHTIGSLPTVLRWDGSEAAANDAAHRGFKLAGKWSLPHFVLEFFCERQMAGRPSLWPEIVRMAHRRASSSAIKCPSINNIRPRLLHTV